MSWKTVLDVVPHLLAFMVMYGLGRNRGKWAERRDMMHRTTQHAIIDTIVAFKERERPVSIGALISVMPQWPHKIYPVVEHMLLTGKIIVTNPTHIADMEPRYFDLPTPKAEAEEPADLGTSKQKEA